jgi:6,7-dimethyl-8-ribityllumazine synthase
MHILEGQLSAAGLSVAIVVGRFNALVTGRLLEGATDCLRRHGGSDDRMTVIYAPGAFEIPFVAQKAAASGSFDAVVCLGCVIRGATPHFDYIAAEAAKGVAQVGLQTGVPVSFGVLTTDTLEQALERAGAKSGNKGWDAALAVMELVQVGKLLGNTQRAPR